MNKYKIEYQVNGAPVWLDASYRAEHNQVNLCDKSDCQTWAGIQEILESSERYQVRYRVS